jgi:hypothetical protein
MPAFELTDTNAPAIRTSACRNPGMIVPQYYHGNPRRSPDRMVAKSAWELASPHADFFHHLHPHHSGSSGTIALLLAGGLAVFCACPVVTGILEMFYYIPTPEHAAVS